MESARLSFISRITLSYREETFTLPHHSMLFKELPSHIEKKPPERTGTSVVSGITLSYREETIYKTLHCNILQNYLLNIEKKLPLL